MKQLQTCRYVRKNV